MIAPIKLKQFLVVDFRVLYRLRRRGRQAFRETSEKGKPCAYLPRYSIPYIRDEDIGIQNENLVQRPLPSTTTRHSEVIRLVVI